MIFCGKKVKFGLSGIVLLVFYWVFLVLVPLFHLHPGEYHPDSIGDVYHSHAAPFTPLSSEHNEDDHAEDEPINHSSKTIAPSNEIVGVVRVNLNNIINSVKFSLALDIFLPTSSESSQRQLFRRESFSLSLPQGQRDYDVLAATNLSPPQV